MYQPTDIIKKQTAAEMVRAYNLAAERIKDAYGLLAEAESILVGTFGSYTRYGDFRVVDREHGWNYREPEETLKRIDGKIRRSVWKTILDALEIRKVASNKRIHEIEDSLEKGQLPEVTEDEIYALLVSFSQQAAEIHTELVREAFDYLRPHGSRYKTNRKYEIGKKVILSYMVTHSWTISGAFMVQYRSEGKLASIDKAFHLLDGEGIPEGYRSPLIDAINTAPGGVGETEYFSFRCYGNGNLHLTFKRLDLLEKLNAVAGGMNLRGGESL